MEPQLATQRRVPRKRKPEAPPENNERLSKRLSLLNLEHSGTKLYVPVESRQPQSTTTAPFPPYLSAEPLPNGNHNGVNGGHHRRRGGTAVDNGADSMMELDDSKYKVYIRNLDDELSSDSEAEEGGLIFLPDIEKHLRNNRIPPAVLAKPDPDVLNKQLVLYRVPTSISVPEEQDSVRKAILETRERLRERQRGSRDTSAARPAGLANIREDIMLDDRVVLPNRTFAGTPMGPSPAPIPAPAGAVSAIPVVSQGDGDSDAMEID